LGFKLGKFFQILPVLHQVVFIKKYDPYSKNNKYNEILIEDSLED
jgi:hypothetical protein